jgi:transposase-like protein
VARDLGISPYTLHNWVQMDRLDEQYNGNGGKALEESARKEAPGKIAVDQDPIPQPSRACEFEALRVRVDRSVPGHWLLCQALLVGHV